MGKCGRVACAAKSGVASIPRKGHPRSCRVQQHVALLQNQECKRKISNRQITSQKHLWWSLHICTAA